MLSMLEKLAAELGWPLTVAEAKARSLCVRCANPVTPDAEYALSALCSPCFDEITKDPEPECGS